MHNETRGYHKVKLVAMLDEMVCSCQAVNALGIGFTLSVIVLGALMGYSLFITYPVAIVVVKKSSLSYP